MSEELVFVNMYWESGKRTFLLKGHYPLSKLLALAQFSVECIERLRSGTPGLIQQ